MIFANRELAQRLERAEGFACGQFAAARKKVFPECDSAWMRCAGADVRGFDGVDAAQPKRQSTFGLGMFEEVPADGQRGGCSSELTAAERTLRRERSDVQERLCGAGPATMRD